MSIRRKKVEKGKSLALFLVNQFVQSCGTLLFAAVFNRFISPEEFGVQYLFAVVLTIGIGLANWGLPLAYDRFFFQFPAERRSALLGSVFSFSFLVLFFSTGIVWLKEDAIAPLLVVDSQWWPMLTLTFAAGAFAFLNAFALAECKNQQHAVNFVFYDLLRFGLCNALAFVLIVFCDWGIWGLVAAQLVAQGAMFLLVVLEYGARVLFRVDFDALRQCLAFGWPMMGRILLGAFNGTIDKVLLGTVISVASLGLYGKANGWAYLVFMFMTTVQNTYAPIFNHILFKTGGSKGLRLGEVFSEYCAVCAVPSAVMIFFAQEFIWIMAPESFYAAIPLLALLSSYYALLTFGKLQGTLSSYLNMMKICSVFAIIGQFLAIGFNFWLIPIWGCLGAVAATVFSSVSVSALIFAAMARRHVVGYEWRFLVPLYGLILLGLAVVLLEYYFSFNYGIGLAVRVLLISALAWISLGKIGFKRILGAAFRMAPFLSRRWGGHGCQA